METCKVSFVWTKEEAKRALRAQARAALNPGFLLFTRGFTLLFGALLIFFQIASGLFEFFIVGLTLFCIYWTFFPGRGISWLLLLGFTQSHIANKTFSWELSEQLVTQQCENISSSQLSWEFFSKIVVASEGLMLYTFPKSKFFWLPYDGFETPQCIEKVKEFARSNDVKIIEAKR